MKRRTALVLEVALVASPWLAACGREDIELGRPTRVVPSEPSPEPPADVAPDSPEPVSPGTSDPPEPPVALPPAPSASDVDAGVGAPAPAAPVTSAPETPMVDAGIPPAEDCSAAVPEGLVGARPPMGWNGYNAFGEEPTLDEEKLHDIIDALVESGMQRAGYRYVNIDSGWQEERTAEGERVFDAARLPNGIAALADRVHELGFLFGTYSHIQDCRQMAGGEGFEAMDVANYVAWEVDYLKYTSCAVVPQPAEPVVTLATALAAADRSIVLSLAAPPFAEWMRETAHIWRVSENARPTWGSITGAIDATVPLGAYARPGAFNDPDMLSIGNGTLTEGEQRVQFSVWSILAAPLIAGHDVTAMTEPTRAILTNAELIALDQDPLGLQGALVRTDGNVQVLAKPLSTCGARGVVLWNRSMTSAEVSVTLDELWLESDVATVRDLWSGSLIESVATGFTVEVPGRDAVALRVEGLEPERPRGTVFLSDVRFSYVTNGYGPVELDRTNGETGATDGSPIRLRGAAYDKGLGVHGPSLVRYRLGQACSRFVADVGIDDDQGGLGSVEFEIWADGERLFRSGVVTGASPPVAVDVDVRGRRDLRLFVSTGGDTYAHDHAVWAGAVLECEP